MPAAAVVDLGWLCIDAMNVSSVACDNAPWLSVVYTSGKAHDYYIASDDERKKAYQAIMEAMKKGKP